MRKLTAFVLIAGIWACGQSTPPDYFFPPPEASPVPFEVPAIGVGDSVVVDVRPLFWGEALRYGASSSDTTVARARMDRELLRRPPPVERLAEVPHRHRAFR